MGRDRASMRLGHRDAPVDDWQDPPCDQRKIFRWTNFAGRKGGKTSGGYLVGLGRVELPTFPIRSGRSSQFLNMRMALQLFDLTFATAGLGSTRELLRIERFPWAATARR